MAIYETPPTNDAIEALRKIEAIAKSSPGQAGYAFNMGQIQHIAWRELMRNDNRAKETV